MEGCDANDEVVGELSENRPYARMLSRRIPHERSLARAREGI
jgi:hypothetical protein